MLLGIDVGGTNTDGVLYSAGEILKVAKHPTQKNDLKGSVLSVLDELLENRKAKDLKRIVFSTTLVTNLVATGQGEKVALVLIPGPGLNLRQLKFFPEASLLDGATDFRGRITEPLNPAQIEELGQRLAQEGFREVAVVGKFSNRNHSHEHQVAEILKARHPGLNITLGSDVSGELNFLRRATTTYYTAATKNQWGVFAFDISEALEQRGTKAPVFTLKADGGTMPLLVSRTHPCETVFSGPAASVMGAFALTMDEKTSVVVDVGGTTTDLALIIEGKPLYGSRGAVIGGYYSNVLAFAVRSVPLGGDSAVFWQGGKVVVGPERLGPAACFGGPQATPTDAINVLTGGSLGQSDLSRQALEKISGPAGLSVEELAQKTADQVTGRLEESVAQMFKVWEEEPAYRVWELLNKRTLKPERVIGIGAAAKAFIPSLAKRLQCASYVHRFADCANALGACVSRPTLSLLLHADSEQQVYHLSSEGINGAFKANQLKEAKALALDWLKQIAEKRGLGQYADRYEYFLEEQFNMVRGWSTTGKIFDVGVQIAPGVIDEFKGVPQEAAKGGL